MRWKALFIALIAALPFALAWAGPAAAQAGADRAALQSIIRDQVAAFTRGDAAGAYAFASPGIREVFPDTEKFMDMVRRGYPALIGPRSLTFGDMQASSDEAVQQVFVVDSAEKPWIALYLLERDAAGAWRIKGCVMTPDKGQAI